MCFGFEVDDDPGFKEAAKADVPRKVEYFTPMKLRPPRLGDCHDCGVRLDTLYGECGSRCPACTIEFNVRVEAAHRAMRKGQTCR